MTQPVPKIDGDLVRVSPSGLADALAEALADKPEVYVLVDGKHSDDTLDGSLMLATGELVWSTERAADLDALKRSLVFDVDGEDASRLDRLVKLYPDGFRTVVIEGELPAWLAEANRNFVIESGTVEEAVDPLGVGPSGTGLVACPMCDGRGEDVYGVPCEPCGGSGYVTTQVEA